MRRPEAACWTGGGIGLGVVGVGWLVQPAAFHFAWLAALTTWWGWPLGSMALLLIHRLTGGQWGEALTPALRAGAACTPLLLPALAPVLLGLAIYPWAQAGFSALPNHFYLNVPFLMVRLAIDLVLWIGLAGLTLRGRGSGTPAIGLPVLALSFTFAAIDLILSLEPAFNSSIFGMIQGAAAVLLALSIAALPATLTAPRAVLADIAKLMLALVVLWAYLDAMQFIIVWESNLPNEAPWYVLRMRGAWGGVFAGLALLHGALPLALLMLPPIQRSRRALAGVAALLVAMGAIRGWWTVLPEAHRLPGWIDAGCLLAFAGIGAGWTLHARHARWLPRHV